MVLDVATVKEFPRLAALASRSGNSTAFPLFPSGTVEPEIGNVGGLTEKVALEEGWEIRGMSFKVSWDELFELFANDFPSHR